MISERDVQAYRRDGVIVVPDVLGAETLATVRTVIAELVAGAAKTLEHTEIYDLEPGHTAEAPRVRRIKAPHKVHAIFDQIVRSPAVIDDTPASLATADRVGAECGSSISEVLIRP